MDKNVYKKVVESLKLANRAELTSIDPKLSNAIDNCYVDPIGDSIVLDQVLNRIPCYLVGRKGTGKSTIFQKAQIEIGKKENALSAYIDVKSVFENINKSFSFHDDFYVKELGQEKVNALSRYFLLKRTIEKIYKEILKCISEKPEQQKSLFPFFSNTKKNQLAKIEEKIKALLESASEDEYQDLSLLKSVTIGTASAEKKQSNENLSATTKASMTNASVELAAKTGTAQEATTNSSESFSQLVAKYLSIQEKFSEIKQIFNENGFDHIYLFFDDYSELDNDVQETLLQSIIEPLYFFSEEFININIAAYPKRVNYGQIPTDKIEIIHLDFQDLYTYYNKDINKREQIATEKIAELLKKRFDFYSNSSSNLSDFIDTKFGLNSFLELVFQITLGNPRYIGWLLDYTGRLSILSDTLITESSVKSASQHYYQAKIESKIDQTAQALLPYGELAKFASHIELLKALVAEARDSRKGVLEYKAYESLKTPQTSHFYTDLITSKFLSLLELNFFVHKLRPARDKASNDIQIYALNHGLCQKHKISFGRPTGTEYRSYLIETIFNRTKTISDHFHKVKEIKCSECQHEFEESDLAALKMFNFRCSSCGAGENSVKIMFSTPLTETIKQFFPEELKQDIYSVEMLYTIKTNNQEIYAAQIAQALDKHHVSVGQKASQLREKGYLEKETRSTPDAGRRVFYKLKSDAEDIFFNVKNKLADVIFKEPESED